MYTEVQVAGKKLNALIDTGASHLFISTLAANKLKLSVEKTKTWLKTVNSKEVPTVGVAKGVDLQIGSWQGKESIEVVSLDDFEFVIGMEFLDKIDALIVPRSNCLCVLHEKSQCVIPITRKVGQATKFLSAMQLAKGLKRNEVTYIATLMDCEPVKETPIPDIVGELLEEFKGVMPPELPKRFPPRREVDH